MTPAQATLQGRRDVALRGLLSAEKLGGGRPHGERLRYMAGCRCNLCRKANSAYENARARARKAGDWNGIVPADKARAHILKLSRQGVGRRAIAQSTDLAESMIFEIRKGIRTHIRARTERKILAVGRAQMCDSALIDAAPTWKLIAALLEEGFTRVRLARELGQKGQGLQLGKRRITVRNAERVRVLHRRLTT